MVKIRRIKLSNLKLIKQIYGKEELEINFSDNGICLIVGENGSGKSLLLQELNLSPYDPVRNRGGVPETIGDSGSKELDVELDGKYLYKIVIKFEGKTTCFIHKYNLYTDEDLGELNPNGNVNSYYDIVKKELGWEKSYLNIGYLSKSVTSLILMKPTERSNYMTLWLPQLDEFINGYKIISKKSNLLKKQIDLLNNDIGKLSDTDYDILIKNYKDEIEGLEKSYTENMSNKTKIETYLGIIKKIDRDELTKRIETLKNNAKILEKQRVEILNEYETLKIYQGPKGKKLLEKTLKEAQNNILVLSEKIKSSDALLLSLESEMKEIKAENNLENSIETNIVEIENNLKSLDDDIADLETTKKLYLKNEPEFKEIESLNKLDIDIFGNVMENLLDLRSKIVDLIPNEYLKDNEILTNGNTEILELEKVYQERADKIDEQILAATNRIYMLKNSKITKDLLELKPKECKRECNIVNELMKLIYPESEIKSNEEILKKLLEEETDINLKITNIKDKSQKFSVAFSYINELNDRIIKNKEMISKFPKFIIDSFMNPDICSILNSIPIISDKIQKYKEFIYLNEKLNVTIEAKHNASAEYSLLKMQKNINEKWALLHEKWLENMKNREKLMDDFQKNENIEKRMNDINIINEQNSKMITEYNLKAENLEAEKQKLSEYAKSYYLWNRCNDTKGKLEIEIYRMKNRLDELKEKLEALKAKQNSIQTLMDSRDDLLKQKKRVDILADIWSPKTGYPSWEMEEFLDELTVQTNKDLDQMWGGDLKIEKFDIGANEFNIVVNRNGNIIKDASECSEGEQATLSLATSFAIIEVNLRNRKYNVLRFDEVDGPFDSFRRRTFLSTLQSRLPSIDCGNLFIITHNNEMSDIEADMIILRGAEEDGMNMNNKNIVYHY